MTHCRTTSQLRPSQRLLILVTAEPLPVTFAIDDGSVSTVGHDPVTGLLTVHVESDHDPARATLERLYDKCRGGARTIA